VEKPAFRKGPFSYTIEKDIDRYLDYKKNHLHEANTSKNSPKGTVAAAEDDVIIELGEDLMHPLVDSTNPRLQTSCAEYKKAGAEPVGSTLGMNTCCFDRVYLCTIV